MKSGYTKAWRRELQSDIWQMPPLYHRVWLWLRQKAKYKVEEFPTKRGYGVWLLPGQFLTSYDHIAKGVGWMEWGKEKNPNKKTVKEVLDWLTFSNMVTVESNAFGTLITIVNWDTYNVVDAQKVTVESNDVGADKKRLLDTIKELQEKNKELIKNKDSKDSVEDKDYDEEIKQIIAHLNKQADKNFKPQAKLTRALIKARFRDGFALDDFMGVINKKTVQWLNDVKMDKCLRPSTLFSPSKFEAYVNEKMTFAPQDTKPSSPLQGSIAKKNFRKGIE
jgi:uncharacterized phage protein (TIGR02220 family)